MTRPEGISESAWQKSVEPTDAALDAMASWLGDISETPEVRQIIARAIQSSVEAERAKIVLEILQIGEEADSQSYWSVASEIASRIKGA